MNIDDNIAFLDTILATFKDMQTQHSMQSLNMGEISDLISSGNK